MSLKNTLSDDPCPTCGVRGCVGSCCAEDLYPPEWWEDESPVGPDFGQCPACVACGGLCRGCEESLGAQADYYEEEARRQREG